jgi:hypothetical protein
MPSLCLPINRHLIKFGVVRHRVTLVAQNTHHDTTVKDGYVAFANEGVKAGKYRACNSFNIDKTNIDFDLVSGATLAGCGELTIACTTTGSSNRCTVMLGVTMDGDKQYAREEFESWMVSNGSCKKPTRGEVSQWIKIVWEKVTTATIVNTWKSIAYKSGYKEDGETIIQNNQQEEDERD